MHFLKKLYEDDPPKRSLWAYLGSFLIFILLSLFVYFYNIERLMVGLLGIFFALLFEWKRIFYKKKGSYGVLCLVVINVIFWFHMLSIHDFYAVRRGNYKISFVHVVIFLLPVFLGLFRDIFYTLEKWIFHKIKEKIYVKRLKIYKLSPMNFQKKTTTKALLFLKIFLGFYGIKIFCILFVIPISQSIHGLRMPNGFLFLMGLIFCRLGSLIMTHMQKKANKDNGFFFLPTGNLLDIFGSVLFLPLFSFLCEIFLGICVFLRYLMDTSILLQILFLSLMTFSVFVMQKIYTWYFSPSEF